MMHLELCKFDEFLQYKSLALVKMSVFWL